jgi:hypothetical protein
VNLFSLGPWIYILRVAGFIFYGISGFLFKDKNLQWIDTLWFIGGFILSDYIILPDALSGERILFIKVITGFILQAEVGNAINYRKVGIVINNESLPRGRGLPHREDY